MRCVVSQVTIQSKGKVLLEWSLFASNFYAEYGIPLQKLATVVMRTLQSFLMLTKPTTL